LRKLQLSWNKHEAIGAERPVGASLGQFLMGKMKYKLSNGPVAAQKIFSYPQNFPSLNNSDLLAIPYHRSRGFADRSGDSLPLADSKQELG
jgi:hypothetical protein